MLKKVINSVSETHKRITSSCITRNITMEGKLVVIVTWATRGDFNPMLALALECQRRGARVVVACDEEARKWVTSAGIDFLTTGPFPSTPLSQPGDPDAIFSHPKFLEWDDYARLDFVFSEVVSREYEKVVPLLKDYFILNSPSLVIAHAGCLGALDVALVYANVLAAFMFPTSVSLPTKWSGYKLTMTWPQYFNNLWLKAKEIKISVKYLLGQQKIRKRYGYRGDMMEIYNTTRCIQSSVYGISLPIPLPPNISLVGPFLSEEEDNIMDENLKEWLDNRNSIYVSFGTTGNPSDKQWETMIKGLQKSNYNVLISARDHTHELLLSLISNNSQFRLEHWVPQKSVLKHKSIKVFVSHCGFGSFNESLYYAKPILGIPFFFDQTDMATRLEEFGAGIKLDRTKLDTTIISNSITKIIENKSYEENAKRLSVIMRAAGGVKRAVDISSLSRFLSLSLTRFLSHSLSLSLAFSH